MGRTTGCPTNDSLTRTIGGPSPLEMGTGEPLTLLG